MKKKRLLVLLILCAMIAPACSSTSEKNEMDNSQELANEIDGAENFEEDDEFEEESEEELAQEDLEEFDDFDDEENLEENGGEGEEAFAENDEQDLDESSIGGDEEAIEEVAEEAIESGADEIGFAEEESADYAAEDIPQDNSDNKIVGLDFLSNQDGGTIMISTKNPTEFKQRKNLNTGQYIVELDNVVLPKKFQRPYDTREFGGAIGLFQAYQEPGSSVARFVIQLNGDAEPLISKEGNSIMVLASTKADEAITTEQIKVAEAEAAISEVSSNTVDREAIKRDKKVLGEKSIEDFLIGNTNYYGKKMNIELVNTDILRVFDIIAEQSNLNIVVSEQVKGKITLKLRDIPWDQALMVVLQSKQLGYVKNGNILRIAPLKKIEQESKEARQVIEAQKKLQPVRVRIFPISFAKATDIVSQIKDFLTDTRGKAKADERTNSIIVTDVPEVLDVIAKLTKKLDTETPQVLMEAKFVEASEQFSKDLNFNIAGNTMSNLTNSVGTTVNYFGPDSSDTSVLGGFFMTFSGLKNIGNLSARLSLYEKRNLARVISAPRVVGINNEEATISQTNQFLDISQTLAGGDTNNVTVTFTPKDVKTELKIKPQITAEGSVLMDITVQRDVPGAVETAGDASSRPINTRSATTKVLVPNGDTVVIGGVYSFDNTKVKTKIPFLGDVPILGTLFKNDEGIYSKSELMIFVTPRVLNIDKAFNRGSILSEGESESKSF